MTGLSRGPLACLKQRSVAALFSMAAFGYGVASRLSLAVKLYSVFALFAVLIAAITALSGYNTHRNAELTEAIETANRAALNVERVNSLVYAVVMESRGVYMSTEAADVKKYGDAVLKFNDQILAVVKNWESITLADDAGQFVILKKRIEQFVDFRKELVRRGIELGHAAGRDGATTMPIAPCVPPSTRILRRSPRSMPNAASGSPGRRSQPRNGPASDLSRRHCAGAGRHRRPDRLPLGRAAAFGNHLHHQAGGRGRRKCRGSAYRPRRRDRRPGACDRHFQGAMERNRNLNSQVLQESRAREQRARHIETSVEAFRGAIGHVMRAVTDNASAMRHTAQSIATVASDASGRAVAATSATDRLPATYLPSPAPPRAFGFGRGDRPTGPPVRRRGRAGWPADRNISDRN